MADALAAQLHAPAPLELELGVSTNVAQPAVTTNGPASAGTQNLPTAIISLHGHGVGAMFYVATPALLAKAFGITGVNPGRRRRTLRCARSSPSTGGGLALVSGTYQAQSPPGCPAGLCILSPVIQEVTKLPSGTSLPNTVITEQAVKALHETVVPVGWLLQAPSALTPAQVNAARQAAVGLGTSVETQVRPAPASARSATAPTRRRPAARARRPRDDRRHDPQRDPARPAHAHRGGRRRAHQAGALPASPRR